MSYDIIDRQWLSTMALIGYSRPNYKLRQGALNRQRLRSLTKGLIQSDRICTVWSDEKVEDTMEKLLITTREAMIPNTN